MEFQCGVIIFCIVAARGRGRAAAPAMRGGRGGTWQPGAQQGGSQGGRGR